MRLKILISFISFFLIGLFLFGFIDLNVNREYSSSELYIPVHDSITICRNGLNKPISDNQSTFDTINISGLPIPSTIMMVEVTLDTIIHTWDADLEIILWKGSVLDTLVRDRGGSGQNFIGTNLTDTAIVSIANGVAPFTGYYRAEYPLSIFNGIDPSGDWILDIYDDAPGDQGVLQSWCITIHYEGPSGIVNQSSTPKEYSLSQNNPNPFNPITNIKFDIPEEGFVSLKVYDIVGKEVATLVNEVKPAGSYIVKFDGSNLSNSVYYYKMQTGDFFEVRKMVLIK